MFVILIIFLKKNSIIEIILYTVHFHHETKTIFNYAS